MRVLRGDREDIGLKTIVLSKALLKVLQLGQHEQVVFTPIEQERLDLFVSLRSPSGWKCAGSRLAVVKVRYIPLISSPADHRPGGKSGAPTFSSVFAKSDISLM